MAKRYFLFLLAALLGSLSLQAQQYDVLDQVRADARKSWGMEGPHRFDEIVPLTKSPKGYEPFYISHYGRHGSRYAWSSKTYILLHDVFAKAAELNVLTPYGKQFAEKYEAFYMEPWINTGDLVPLGFDQHERIGTFVYDNFPKVFKGDRQVDALASTAQRCIVSMSAFVQGLTKGNGALRVRQGSTHVGMCVIAPPSAPKDMLRHFKGENDPIEGLISPEEFMHSKEFGQGILGKLFTDSSFLKEFKGGEDNFIQQMWAMISNYHNFETQPLFDDLFSDDDRVNAWESDNYASYYTDLRQRYAVIPLLEDILQKADYALAHPSQAANLRFGHDYIVEAFAALLNLNQCGILLDNPDDVKYWFQSYNVPMASTLLFVFYKNKKGDVLFKVIWNEKEAIIPQLQAVQGPYYRWNDFTAWAKDIMAAHPEI